MVLRMKQHDNTHCISESGNCPRWLFSLQVASLSLASLAGFPRWPPTLVSLAGRPRWSLWRSHFTYTFLHRSHCTCYLCLSYLLYLLHLRAPAFLFYLFQPSPPYLRFIPFFLDLLPHSSSLCLKGLLVRSYRVSAREWYLG
jgi:hypothetical protein